MAKPAQVDRQGRSRLVVALGDIICELREARGLSQSELAVLVGLHVKTFATYEQGTRGMSFERFVEVCHALRVSPSTVIDEVQRHECSAVRITAMLVAGDESGAETDE